MQNKSDFENFSTAEARRRKEVAESKFPVMHRLSQRTMRSPVPSRIVSQRGQCAISDQERIVPFGRRYLTESVGLFLILVGLVTIIPSTQSIGQTSSDRDTKVDFNMYTSYAWIAPGESALNQVRKDKLFGGTIMYRANEEIRKRGLAIDTLQPQALFIFHTTVEDRVQYSQSPTLSVGVAVMGPGYYVGGSAPVAGGKITASPYLNGTLTFEMIDAKTGKVLWWGATRKDFENQDDISKLIAESVVKIFKKFPKKVVKNK